MCVCVCAREYACVCTFLWLCECVSTWEIWALLSFLRLTLSLHPFIHSSITLKRQSERLTNKTSGHISSSWCFHLSYKTEFYFICRYCVTILATQSVSVFCILKTSICFQNGSLAIHKVDWLTCIYMENISSIIHLSASKCLIVCMLASFHWMQLKC